MPITIYAGETLLSIEGRPVRTLVAAKSRNRARRLLERVSVFISAHAFRTSWEESESPQERSMAQEEGIWIKRQTPPRYLRLDWSAGRLYSAEPRAD